MTSSKLHRGLEIRTFPIGDAAANFVDIKRHTILTAAEIKIMLQTYFENTRAGLVLAAKSLTQPQYEIVLTPAIDAGGRKTAAAAPM